jgi:diacylglycerol O-acyltransferase / wax synthase
MARLSRRLSAYDSVFLEWERPEQPVHVAECMVYTRAGSPRRT